MIAGLSALLVALLLVGAAVLARHRAQNAADLAALAGAAAHLGAGGDGCGRARSIAEVQEGSPRLVRCAVDGPDVLVAVVVPVRLGRWGVREARAQARAGPVDG